MHHVVQSLFAHEHNTNEIDSYNRNIKRLLVCLFKVYENISACRAGTRYAHCRPHDRLKNTKRSKTLTKYTKSFASLFSDIYNAFSLSHLNVPATPPCSINNHNDVPPLFHALVCQPDAPGPHCADHAFGAHTEKSQSCSRSPGVVELSGGWSSLCILEERGFG